MNKKEEYQEYNRGKIDVDIWDFIPKLKKSSRFILYFALCFAVLGGLVAFGSTKKYKAEMLLSPELNGSEEGNLSSIADIVGLSFDFGGGSEAVNVMIYPNVVSSKRFLMDLADIPVRTEDNDSMSLRMFFKENEKGGLDFVWKGIGALRRMISGKKKVPGVGIDSGNSSSFIFLSEQDALFVDRLKKSVDINVDDKTGLIMVSATTADPYVSAALTDTVGKRLQSYITNYRTTKAKQDYEYYNNMSRDAERKYRETLDTYADYVDSNMQAVLQRVKGKQDKLESEVALVSQVYMQLEQKKELAKAKIQEVKPAFVVIDPVSVPLKPVGLGRILTILLSFIIGGVLACMWVLVGEEIWMRLKEEEGS